MSTVAARPPFTRRGLLQSAGIALAAANLPIWSAATHARDDVADLPALIVEGNNEFAFDLYAALREDADGNLLISPYSVSVALAMVQAGAAGETESQLGDVLGNHLDPELLAETFRDLSADLERRGTADEDEDEGQAARGLAIANSIWGDAAYPFNEDYLAVLEDGFESELNQVDFAADPEGVREEINTWVLDNTNNRIQNIVPEGLLSEDTRLVLANAIWFSGPWQHTFEPDNTEEADFTLLDGSQVEVPFMFQQESLPYLEGDGFEAIELPYDGSGFAFTVVVPDEGEFETVEASLDAATLGDIAADLESVDVRLSLPSFTFDSATNLSETLQALGVIDAFDDDLANFRPMAASDEADPLFITAVLHKAFIAVDENGTEAAAATVVSMDGATAIEEEEEPIELVIDRPFLFAIRDTDTGVVLFVGRVLDPS